VQQSRMQEEKGKRKMKKKKEEGRVAPCFKSRDFHLAGWEKLESCSGIVCCWVTYLVCYRTGYASNYSAWCIDAATREAQQQALLKPRQNPQIHERYPSTQKNFVLPRVTSKSRIRIFSPCSLPLYPLKVLKYPTLFRFTGGSPRAMRCCSLIAISAETTL